MKKYSYSEVMLMPSFTLEAVIKNENGRFDFTKDELHELVVELVKVNNCDTFKAGQKVKVPVEY